MTIEMKMTEEQSKVIHRCKAMIKRAFPNLTGKIIFRLQSHQFGMKGIHVDMFLPDLKIPEPSKEVTEVDLG